MAHADSQRLALVSVIVLPVGKYPDGRGRIGNSLATIARTRGKGFTLLRGLYLPGA